MKLYTTLIFAVMLSFSCYCQALEFGISAGLSGYAGDLDAPELTTNLQNSKAAVGIFARNTLTNRLSVRGNLMIGKIIGDDQLSTQQWQKDRNLSFKSNIVEVAALVELNLFNFGDEGKRWTPFLAAGAAYFHHNPTTEYNGQDVQLQPLGTEGQGGPGYADRYNLNLFTVPFGGGIKYKLNDKITLQGEFLSRFTFNDYLDDVSGNYVNFFELTANNGPLAAALGNRHPDFSIASQVETGAQRGKADVNDYYYTGMFSVVFTIGEVRGRSGEGCYQF